jgi:periplasmic protein TonB
VQRFLPALFLALCFHGLLLLLPYSEKSTTPPLLPGKKTIRISLSGDVTVKPEAKRPDHEEEDIVPKVPMEPEEPALQQPKNDAPVVLQAQSVKKHVRKQVHPKAKPATNRPPINPAPEQSPPTVPPKVVETAAPVTVKAIPLYKTNPKPDYPSLARRRNWQGTVTLAVTVSEQGSVTQVTLHKSSGHELLDKTALKTVKTWHFIPGRNNDRAAVMEVLVPVHFKLD